MRRTSRVCVRVGLASPWGGMCRNSTAATMASTRNNAALRPLRVSYEAAGNQISAARIYFETDALRLQAGEP